MSALKIAEDTWLDGWFNQPTESIAKLRSSQQMAFGGYNKVDQDLIRRRFLADYPLMKKDPRELKRDDLIAGIMAGTGRTKSSFKGYSRARLMALFHTLFKKDIVHRMDIIENIASRNNKKPSFYKNLSDLDLMTMIYERSKYYLPRGVTLISIPKTPGRKTVGELKEFLRVMKPAMKAVEAMEKNESAMQTMVKQHSSFVNPRAGGGDVGEFLNSMDQLMGSSSKPKAVKPKAVKPKAVKPKAVKPKSSSGKRIPLLKAIAEKTGNKRVYKGKTIAELKKMLANLSRPQKFRDQDEEKEEFRPPNKRKPVGRRPIAPIGPPAGGLPPPAPPSRTIKELKNSLRKYNEENCEKLSGNKAALLAKARKRGI